MTAEAPPPIEAWFWELLAQSRPSLDRLRSALFAAERSRLEQFLFYYRLASEHVREPWDGPLIKAIGGSLSEDGTEDLADWIVAQGKAACDYAASESADWDELFALSYDVHAGRCEEVARWHVRHPDNTQSKWGSARYVAMDVFERRFGESFCDIEEELFEKYFPSPGSPSP